MPRRTKAAIAAGQPQSADPTEFVGRNDRGAVRPADDRFISDAEIDERDRYLLEVTGPEAQQLVHKREAFRSLMAQVSDDDLDAILRGSDTLAPDVVDEFGGINRGRLEASVTTLNGQDLSMSNAEYRRLLAAFEDAIERAAQPDEDTAGDVPAEEGDRK